MDEELRRAWSEIVVADDYEQHMAAIGQAQAAAELNRHLIEAASLKAGACIIVAGCGTGHMFDLLPPALFQPYQLIVSDLNARFLARLQERLIRQGLKAERVVDDIERSALAPGCDLLLATLLLEHIDWQRGVEAFVKLMPRMCGIVLQENPPDMKSAVTPGRRLPPSMAKAMETARPALVPREDLIAAMANRAYDCIGNSIRDVADGKRLVALLFSKSDSIRNDSGV